ncbi:MAG: hypothetical protein K2O66_08140 [Bacteroidales bacterium]|nr:hypothetical protein [Bacteroidales bacterium]MDE7073315.1 hypothetical protein [Bacteroidales bacterium]
MKNRVFLFLVYFFSGICFLFAQENNMVTIYNFEDNRLQWEEFATKTSSATLSGGFYILTNKQTSEPAKSITNFPVNVKENFKIKVTMLIPKISKDNYFGLVYDYKEKQEKGSFKSFLVAEGKYKVCSGSELEYVAAKKDAQRITLNRKASGDIILKSGKDREVEFEIEKKGLQLVFSVNNMEVYKCKEELSSKTFGFIVEGKNTIKVKEVSIEQIKEEANW